MVMVESKVSLIYGLLSIIIWLAVFSIATLSYPLNGFLSHPDEGVRIFLGLETLRTIRLPLMSSLYLLGLTYLAQF